MCLIGALSYLTSARAIKIVDASPELSHLFSAWHISNSLVVIKSASADADIMIRRTMSIQRKGYGGRCSKKEYTGMKQAQRKVARGSHLGSPALNRKAFSEPEASRPDK